MKRNKPLLPRDWSTAFRIRWKQIVGRRRSRRAPTTPAINQWEYRVFSQHREDGVIDHLLDSVGAGNRMFVEFGFGPDVCNCLNLVMNRAFSGLFIDGSEEKCRIARAVYERLDKREVTVVESFLTTENINQTILEAGVTGEIDVLSIDVDGNDYWFWAALTAVKPRVVIIEYNASLGRDRSLTVPYDPAFVRYEKHASGFYHGASLLALVRLGKKIGYRLVGCDSTGVNAFFLRDDLHAPGIDTLSVDEAFFPHRSRVKYKHISESEQFERIRTMEFVQVDPDDPPTSPREAHIASPTPKR